LSFWLQLLTLYRFLFHWTKHPTTHNHLPLVHIPNPISFNWYLIILVDYFRAKEYHLGGHKCSFITHINQKNFRLLINYQDITKWNIWAFKYIPMVNNSYNVTCHKLIITKFFIGMTFVIVKKRFYKDSIFHNLHDLPIWNLLI
jgi:hypothetical protein